MSTASGAPGRRVLRMGTRASALARAQSEAEAAALERACGYSVETVVVRTHGDQLSVEGKAPPGGDEAGVFTRALDEALRSNEIDFAVHSLKDLPTADEEDLVLAAVPRRGDPRDALVVASRHGNGGIERLPQGARVATSSPRRISQLARLRPDLAPVVMAGNVDTRLLRLEEGRADALILACAGLDRLGRSAVIARRLPFEEMLPAPGQGALALVCRAGDEEARRALAVLDDVPSRAAADAERSLLRALRGGCRAPVGAFSEPDGRGGLRLRGRVLSLDGRDVLEADASGPLEEPAELGRRAAGTLLAQGAARLVDAARAAAL